MRIYKYVPLLTAILPLALAQYSTPPPPTNPTCSLGTYQCFDNTFQKCSDDGNWQDIETCSMTAHCSAQDPVTGHGGCFPNADVTDSKTQCSVIAERRCDSNNNLQECPDHGQWGTIKNCTMTAMCSAQRNATDHGGCYPLLVDKDQCSEVGLHRCANGTQTLQTCGDLGYWKIAKNCTENAYCLVQQGLDGGGDCHLNLSGDDKLCATANEVRCNKGVLETCAPSGFWKTVTHCKKNEMCQVNSKFPDGGICSPSSPPPPKGDDKNKCLIVGTFRCDNNALEKCDSTGYWKNVKQCKKSETCQTNSKLTDGGQCLLPSPPPPKDGDAERCPKVNAYRCKNNVLENCDNTGHWPDGYWKKVKQCRETETCTVNSKYVDGMCVPEFVPADPYPAPPNEPSPVPLKGDKNRCKANERRCNENEIETCSMRELWADVESCGEHGICIDNCGRSGCKPYCMDRIEYYTGIGGANDTSTSGKAPTVARSELEPCDRPGLERCMYDAPIRTQSCTNGTWVDKQICPANTICLAWNDGDETAECAPKLDFPPHPASVNTRSIWPTKPCHAGDFNCDSNHYGLLVCKEDQKWHFSKKCLGPGDCKVDGPGKAHCQNGEMDPPKTKRSVCNAGDLACDKDRRFLFTCNDGGSWDEAFQCFRDGYCRSESWSPLTCAGFPLFDGNDGACKSHCEGMGYLYCIGGDWDKPEKIQECLSSMCDDNDCRTCDRCNFKLPYGVKPQLDPSTLVRGSKS